MKSNISRRQRNATRSASKIKRSWSDDEQSEWSGRSASERSELPKGRTDRRNRWLKKKSMRSKPSKVKYISGRSILWQQHNRITRDPIESDNNNRMMTLRCGYCTLFIKRSAISDYNRRLIQYLNPVKSRPMSVLCWVLLKCWTRINFGPECLQKRLSVIERIVRDL